MFLLSILVPTYNRLDLTKDLLLDLAQEIEAYDLEEIVEIVVCDNSTNIEQKQQLSDFIDQLGNFIYFYNTGENIGPTMNWRKCVEFSQGENLLFVYSDDSLHKGSISLIVQELSNCNLDLLFFPTTIGPSIDESVLFRNPMLFQHLSKRSFLRLFLLSDKISHSPATFVFNKSLLTYDFLETILFTFPGALKYGAGSDVLFCYNIFANSNFHKISYLNRQVAFFKDHQSSFTSNFDSNFIVTKDTIRTKIFLSKVHFGFFFYVRSFLIHQFNAMTIKRKMILW